VRKITRNAIPSTTLRRRNIAFIFMEFPYNRVEIVGQTGPPVKQATPRRGAALRGADRKESQG
jgi:hypothetical protein